MLTVRAIPRMLNIKKQGEIIMHSYVCIRYLILVLSNHLL